MKRWSFLIFIEIKNKTIYQSPQNKSWINDKHLYWKKVFTKRILREEPISAKGSSTILFLSLDIISSNYSINVF